MKPSEALALHREAIRAIVLKHNATNPRVFGSVLQREDTESSDLDILIEPNEKTSLMDVARIQVEFEHLLGVKIDVLTPMALPVKFRQKVVLEAESI